MKMKIALTLTSIFSTALIVGCSAEQMARIEHNMEVANQKSTERKNACAAEADRYWNQYAGTSAASTEKFIGSGIYEVKVTGSNRYGVCTVTETGTVKGIMNDTVGQPQTNSANSGAEYERGCADAKAGSYDRSGNAGRAYEDGWNSCKR